MVANESIDGLDQQTLLSMLRWQVEAGATDVVQGVPWNRFESSDPPITEKLRAQSPAQTRSNESTPPVRLVDSGQLKTSFEDLKSVSTLEDLRQRLEGFDGGTLKRFATNTVFGDGALSAKLMLIGEAPGAEEDRQGIPFVGPSGKLLDRMLASIGLNRSEVYITNTLYWRPPGNRTPTPEERNATLPFLLRQIELIGPKVLVLLGGPAAQSLLNETTGITRLRGRWIDFQTRNEPNGLSIPALPTFHPAFLLRQPAQKKQAWQDLRAIRARLDG
jgi:DNA polymerase